MFLQLAALQARIMNRFALAWLVEVLGHCKVLPSERLFSTIRLLSTRASLKVEISESQCTVHIAK